MVNFLHAYCSTVSAADRENFQGKGHSKLETHLYGEALPILKFITIFIIIILPLCYYYSSSYYYINAYRQTVDAPSQA